MSLDLMKRVASHLPPWWQHELKRANYRHQIRKGTFGRSEPEHDLMASLVSRGDWVIDVGANVGHYTKRFSDLVGPKGRVIAFEPVPETFALLAANTARFRHHNVTLLNMAASDVTTIVGFQIPRFETGLRNFYQAAVTAGESELEVMTIALDSLALSQSIGLVKIDAEGHDAAVLRGARELIGRDRPTLLVETSPAELVRQLGELGYAHERPAGSPNLLFQASARNR